MMDEILQRAIANQFADFPGLKVDATIPVPADLLNEIVQSTLTGNRQITYLHLNVHRDNRISVEVKSPLWPWPLHLKLRLFSSVDLTQSPKVRAFLENNLLLGKLGALLNALPDGTTLYEDQVAIDITALLPDPQQKKLLELVRELDITTEEGKVILNVRIENSQT
jgi:hypothetical protein